MKYEKIRFGDLYAIDSRNGLSKPSKVRGSGYKMINMGELFANDRIYDIPMELVPLKDSEKVNAKVEVGDLLFARQSLVLEGAGKCSIVMEVSPLTVFESHLIRVRLTDNVNPMFYYYYFHSPLSPMKSIVSQCAQAGIRGSDLQELSVLFPPKEIQDKIANILEQYDSLIENNQKQIKLLEEAAQRLYKEWFVDLRFPGYEETEIIDGIPEGWKKQAIGDAFTTVLGGTPSRANASYWDGDIPWINSGEVNSLRIVKESEFITKLGLKKSSTKLMPKHTTVLAITGATLGQVSYTEIETCANQSVVGIIDEQQEFSTYLYLFVSNNIWSMIGKATGGAQQHINKDIVNEYPIILPNEDIILKLNSVVEPMFSKMADLYIQNMKLVEARDRLLPKLMSGEIEVTNYKQSRDF